MPNRKRKYPDWISQRIKKKDKIKRRIEEDRQWEVFQSSGERTRGKNQLLFVGNVVRGKWKTEGWLGRNGAFSSGFQYVSRAHLSSPFPPLHSTFALYYSRILSSCTRSTASPIDLLCNTDFKGQKNRGKNLQGTELKYAFSLLFYIRK